MLRLFLSTPELDRPRDGTRSRGDRAVLTVWSRRGQRCRAWGVRTDPRSLASSESPSPDDKCVPLLLPLLPLLLPLLPLPARPAVQGEKLLEK